METAITAAVIVLLTWGLMFAGYQLGKLNDLTQKRSDFEQKDKND